MTWPTLHFKGWEDILTIQKNLPERVLGKSSDKSDYIFRGQANADWHLVPTLTRMLNKINPKIDSREAEEIEVALLDYFVTNAHRYFSQAVLATRDNPAARWSLMQHHGGPTRLLDWTNNLLVAAFFAISSHPDQDGAIWIFHAKPVNDEARRKLHSVQAGYKMLQSGMAQSVVQIWMENGSHVERVIAQDGLFTLCHQIFGSQEDLIETAFQPGSDGSRKDLPKMFCRITIPKDLKPVFLRKLDSMDVTPKSLFPGDDGLGRSLRELAMKLAGDLSHHRLTVFFNS